MLFDGYGQRPRITEVPAPACPPDGALLQVRATGLCRSDWHGWMGHDPDVTLPHVPGHEFAGVIAELGTEVTGGFRLGDRVTAPFVNACGRCARCLEGDHQVCERQAQPGVTFWGSFAEYVVVRHADVNLVPVPDGIDFATAAGLGCRFGTAYRAVLDVGRVSEGAWVAVHGCGGLGRSAVLIAAAHGARVIAVDTEASALRAARQLGATAVVDGATEDVPTAIRDLTGGGAEVSLDALGHTVTFTNSLACLRRRGRHVQVGLLLAAHADQRVPMGPVLSGELEILGSHGMAAHAYPRMLAEISAGTLRPDQLIGQQLTLEEGIDALTALSRSSPEGITILRP